MMLLKYILHKQKLVIKLRLGFLVIQRDQETMESKSMVDGPVLYQCIGFLGVGTMATDFGLESLYPYVCM